VEPQFNETYTFSTTTDDGVLLYVNGQLLVNEWVPQTAKRPGAAPSPWWRSSDTTLKWIIFKAAETPWRIFTGAARPPGRWPSFPNRNSIL
jgi:hypothetical protein